MRLIDAEQIGLTDMEIIICDGSYKKASEMLIDRITNAPSIDAVPVVRCENCKYWHREIYNGIEYFNFSSCDLNHHGDGRNFYCADAERKES